MHGGLWIVDELRRAGTCGSHRLISALECWREDPTVFLAPLANRRPAPGTAPMARPGELKRSQTVDVSSPTALVD